VFRGLWSIHEVINDAASEVQLRQSDRSTSAESIVVVVAVGFSMATSSPRRLTFQYSASTLKLNDGPNPGEQQSLEHDPVAQNLLLHPPLL